MSLSKTVAVVTNIKWPDLVEVREDENGKKSLVFLFLRRNSRSLDYGQMQFADLIRGFGHSVYVSVGGVELTPEQFEKSGVYSVKASQTVQTRQGLYNRMSELRTLEEELKLMSVDDPIYFAKAKMVERLRSMLSTAEGTTATNEQLDKSKDDLHKIASLMVAEYTDDDLRKIPSVEALAKLGVKKLTPEWETFLSRWLNANREKILNVTQQPASTGEGVPNTTTGNAQRKLDPGVDLG